MCPPHHEAATMAAHKQWSSSATVIFAIEVRPTTCSFPFAYPSLARQRKFSWLSTPTRARHWLATFLGQGCVLLQSQKAEVPRTSTRLGKLKDWKLLDAGCYGCCCRCCWLRAQFSFERCSWRRHPLLRAFSQFEFHRNFSAHSLK